MRDPGLPRSSSRKRDDSHARRAETPVGRHTACMKRKQWPQLVVYDFTQMTVTVKDVVTTGSMAVATIKPQPK
jgi:hypothetical protein